MSPDAHLDDPQWWLDSALKWGWWKLLDALVDRLRSAYAGAGDGAPALPFSTNGLPPEIADGIRELADPRSELSLAVADVASPRFASAQEALGNLRLQLTRLPDAKARVLLGLLVLAVANSSAPPA